MRSCVTGRRFTPMLLRKSWISRCHSHGQVGHRANASAVTAEGMCTWRTATQPRTRLHRISKVTRLTMTPLPSRLLLRLKASRVKEPSCADRITGPRARRFAAAAAPSKPMTRGLCGRGLYRHPVNAAHASSVARWLANKREICTTRLPVLVPWAALAPRQPLSLVWRDGRCISGKVLHRRHWPNSVESAGLGLPMSARFHEKRAVFHNVQASTSAARCCPGCSAAGSQSLGLAGWQCWLQGWVEEVRAGKHIDDRALCADRLEVARGRCRCTAAYGFSADAGNAGMALQSRAGSAIPAGSVGPSPTGLMASRFC